MLDSAVCPPRMMRAQIERARWFHKALRFAQRAVLQFQSEEAGFLHRARHGEVQYRRAEKPQRV